MTKERRLGRGLEALLGRLQGSGEPMPENASPQAPPDEPYGVPFPRYDSSAARPPEAGPEPLPAPSILPVPAQPQPENPGPGEGTVRIAIARIDGNPFQPRQEFDPAEIESMAESLKAYGLLQPVVVRRVADRYQLVAGERRLRAATKAGWSDVPVQIVEADDRQLAEMAIVENLHRRDLNALEKAASFQRYLEQYGCTQEDLAGRLKIDRSTVANLIRLLELPAAVQDPLRRGTITQGHARALLPLGDEREQIAFCQRIQQEELSVRQTEALVQETIARADAEPLSVVGSDGVKTRSGRAQNAHVTALEQQFRAALGLKVTLSQTSRGRGRLVIQFRSHEEFDRLLEHVCGAQTKTRAG